MAIAAGKLTEKKFQQMVVSLARLTGWKVHTVFDSRRSPAGWVDLFCVRRNRAIACELKVEGGRLTADQRDWLAALEAANIPTYVWRPSDWDQLERVLKGD
jgi:hypothetical protein